MKKLSFICLVTVVFSIACQRDPAEGAKYQIEDQNEVPYNVTSDDSLNMERDKTEVADTVKYPPVRPMGEPNINNDPSGVNRTEEREKK